MTNAGLRALSAVPLMIAGVAGPGVAPGTAPVTGMKTLLAEVRLLDAEPGATALLLGGTGVPLLPPDVVSAIVASYIDPKEPAFPGQPVFPVTDAAAVYAPQQLYPLTGVPSAGFDASVQQGITLMTTAITNQFAAGNHVVAVGESQGADELGRIMQNFLSLPAGQQPTSDQLSFVNLIAEDGPSTGLLARFAIPGVEPLSFPSLGITLDYVEPSNTPWATADYVSEYDGFSDFPQYPLDLLADLNAIDGITYYHGGGNQDAATAIRLPVSDDYTGHTQYFVFPNEDLPLLEPLRQGGHFGNAVADLLQPVLKPLVNLGFGDPDYGYSTGPANELTPIGVLPEPAMILKAFQESVAGIPTGIKDFVGDLGSSSTTSTTTADSLPGLADLADLANGAASLPSVGDLLKGLDTIGAAVSQLGAVTVQTLDALAITLPSYDVALLSHELASGNLLNAIGMTMAVDAGAYTGVVGVIYHDFAEITLLETLSTLQGLFSNS